MTRPEIRRLDKEFKAFIRQRDKVCQLRVLPWPGAGKCGGVLQCSHIKSVGAHKNLQFHPLNAKALCFRHHFYWWAKDPTESAAWVRHYLGERKHLELEYLKKHFSAKYLTPDEVRTFWRTYGT